MGVPAWMRVRIVSNEPCDVGEVAPEKGHSHTTHHRETRHAGQPTATTTATTTTTGHTRGE